MYECGHEPEILEHLLQRCLRSLAKMSAIWPEDTSIRISSVKTHSSSGERRRFCVTLRQAKIDRHGGNEEDEQQHQQQVICMQTSCSVTVAWLTSLITHWILIYSHPVHWDPMRESLSVPRVKVNACTRAIFLLWQNLPLSDHSSSSIATIWKCRRTYIFDLAFPP